MTRFDSTIRACKRIHHRDVPSRPLLHDMPHTARQVGGGVAAWRPRAGSLMTSSGDRWCLLWPIAWPGAEVGLWITRSSTSRSVTRRLRENARRAAGLHGLEIEVGQVCSRPDQAVPAPGDSAPATSRRAVHSLPLRPSLWRSALLALCAAHQAAQTSGLSLRRARMARPVARALPGLRRWRARGAPTLWPARPCRLLRRPMV